MADRRPDFEDANRAKRQKTASSSMDHKPDGKPAAYNPYLAHMYEDEDKEDMNGYGGGAPLPRRLNGTITSSPLAKFQRHKSTSAQARKAEDGPVNAFNGQQLSQNYFSILKTRRGLPVHSQRYVTVSDLV